ncbi:MAG: TetR/AcrR family transcriptional regulator [Gordonia sp. (in: high G+C Gram-positive bacteria)]|uniref:TetR/AcrR family transcriptional regulator n=1 Tax=Gordonia sp. (in: high G+C Gram-positive bacteria) TaxID=84139 RepID=UPI0039E37A25
MTATDSATPTRRTTKSEETRARIIAAAGKVLAEQGYEHTRLSAIAAEAGLQTGSLYYYFDSKEQLVEEALGGGAEYTHRRVREAVDALPESATPGDRLFTAARNFIAARLEIGAVSPAHIRNYRSLPEELRERLRPELEAFSTLWDRLVEDAVTSGEIRADIDPYVLHLFVVHTSEQLAKWPSHTKPTPAATVDTIFALMLDGLTGPAAG